jgi:hypothetical protein
MDAGMPRSVGQHLGEALRSAAVTGAGVKQSQGRQRRASGCRVVLSSTSGRRRGRGRCRAPSSSLGRHRASVGSRVGSGGRDGSWREGDDCASVMAARRRILTA